MGAADAFRFCCRACRFQRGRGAAQGSVPSIAVYFAVYQYMKRWLTLLLGASYLQALSPRPAPPASQPAPPLRRPGSAGFRARGGQIAVAVSAAAANCIAALVRVPTEMVKQRVQAGIYPSAATAIRDMMAKGGARQFLCSRSVVVQMARDVPYAVCLLLSYEALQAVRLSVDNIAAAEDAAPRDAAAKPGAAQEPQPGGEGGAPARRRRSAAAAGIGCVCAPTCATAGRADLPRAARGGGSPRADDASGRAFRGMWVGAASGAVASLATMPMDVIKTRWMVSPERYEGLADVPPPPPPLVLSGHAACLSQVRGVGRCGHPDLPLRGRRLLLQGGAALLPRAAPRPRGSAAA